MNEEELREYIKDLCKDHADTLRQQSILELSAFDMDLSYIYYFDIKNRENSETIEALINSFENETSLELFKMCTDKSLDFDSYRFFEKQKISELKNELLNCLTFTFPLENVLDLNMEEIILENDKFKAYMSTSAEELDKLSTHSHESVREIVFSNENISEETLIKMEKAETHEDLLILLSRLCGASDECTKLYDMYIDQLNLIIKTFQISLGVSEEDLKLLVEYVNEDFDLKTFENIQEERYYMCFEDFVIDYVEYLKESYEDSDLMFSLRNPVEIVRTPRPKK